MLTLFKSNASVSEAEPKNDDFIDEIADISLEEEDEFYIPVLKPAPWLFTKEVEKRRVEEMRAKNTQYKRINHFFLKSFIFCAALNERKNLWIM